MSKILIFIDIIFSSVIWWGDKEFDQSPWCLRTSQPTYSNQKAVKSNFPVAFVHFPEEYTVLSVFADSENYSNPEFI